jgi:hypothetical protein
MVDEFSGVFCVLTSAFFLVGGISSTILGVYKNSHERSMCAVPLPTERANALANPV